MQRKSAPGCSRDPPAEKIDEERSAHEGGHGANGKLGRGYNGARERVCNYHCDGASKCGGGKQRSEEHTSELQSHSDLVCRLLLEKKKNRDTTATSPAASSEPDDNGA